MNRQHEINDSLSRGLSGSYQPFTNPDLYDFESQAIAAQSKRRDEMTKDFNVAEQAKSDAKRVTAAVITGLLVMMFILGLLAFGAR